MWALLYTLATLALAHSGCASELSETSEASRTSKLATEASTLRGVFASFEKNVQTEQNSNAAKDTKGSAIIKVMSDPNNASDLNEASAFNDASVLNASSILNASSVLYDTSILNSPSIPELSRTGNCVSYINGALADHCPPGCEEYSDIDGVRGYTCRGGNFSYNVAGRANDYFKITCTSCVLDPSAMPLFPFSANGILPEVIVRGCPLADTLASLLARAGARGARVVTLDAPRGVISPAWVAGVEGVKELRIVRAVDQHVVPWDVVDALPELSDFRLRDSPVDADFPEGREAARAHPSLSSLELAMLGPHALLPPAARARLPRLTHLYLRGNQIRDVSEDTFAGLDSVEVLDLSRNPVPALGARALAALSRLRRLLLLPTGLKRVETGAFDGLTSLMEVREPRDHLLQDEQIAISKISKLKWQSAGQIARRINRPLEQKGSRVEAFDWTTLCRTAPHKMDRRPC